MLSVLGKRDETVWFLMHGMSPEVQLYGRFTQTLGINERIQENFFMHFKRNFRANNFVQISQPL